MPPKRAPAAAPAAAFAAAPAAAFAAPAPAPALVSGGGFLAAGHYAAPPAPLSSFYAGLAAGTSGIPAAAPAAAPAAPAAPAPRPPLGEAKAPGGRKAADPRAQIAKAFKVSLEGVAFAALQDLGEKAEDPPFTGEVAGPPRAERRPRQNVAAALATVDAGIAAINQQKDEADRAAADKARELRDAIKAARAREQVAKDAARAALGEKKRGGARRGVPEGATHLWREAADEAPAADVVHVAPVRFGRGVLDFLAGLAEEAGAEGAAREVLAAAKARADALFGGGASDSALLAEAALTAVFAHHPALKKTLAASVAGAAALVKLVAHAAVDSAVAASVCRAAAAGLADDAPVPWQAFAPKVEDVFTVALGPGAPEAWRGLARKLIAEAARAARGRRDEDAASEDSA